MEVEKKNEKLYLIVSYFLLTKHLSVFIFIEKNNNNKLVLIERITNS